MQTKKFTKENIVRYSAFYAALLFSVFTFIFFLIKGSNNRAFMGVLTVFYIFIPRLIENVCKIRIQPTLYVFVIFYAVCPLLGFSYDFYYNFSWWDDILHAFAGIIFALLGAYLPKALNKDSEPSVALCAFSAFFFSVAIAGLWELVEFFTDSYFGTDMQKDTILLAMRPSYLLSEKLGAPVGELLDVNDMQIIMNGTILDNYIDIGLIDSMKDILVETIGAGVYLVLYRASGGKHFTLTPAPETEEESASTPLIEAVPVTENPDVEIAPSLSESVQESQKTISDTSTSSSEN